MNRKNITVECDHEFLVDCSVVHIDPEFPGDDGLRQRIFAQCLELECDLFLESDEIAKVLEQYFKEHTKERSNA